MGLLGRDGVEISQLRGGCGILIDAEAQTALRIRPYARVRTDFSKHSQTFAIVFANAFARATFLVYINYCNLNAGTRLPYAEEVRQ
jgi:hypothetical protein